MQKNALRKSLISHKFDLILGTVLLIAALCLFLIFKFVLVKEGGTVQVKQSNRIVGTYSLSEEGEYEFKTFYGSNILTIKDGYAYVSSSSCDDHICEKMGRISKVGESIICLPNELFITVIDGEASDYDAIAN